jgi:cytochrome c-type biogenesis protein CcmF
MNSVFSRESLFLINNLLFMGILLVCFWGVIYPLVRELFTGEKVTVSAPYYESAAGPLFAALLLLMGIAPLSAWSASTYRSLGRAVWKPALVSLAAPVIALILGVRNAWAIVAIWLVGFVIAVTIYDYAKAVISVPGEPVRIFPWHSGVWVGKTAGGTVDTLFTWELC